MLAKAHGAKNIIVSGHHDERLKRIVDETGAIACNTHKQDLEKTLNSVVGSLGVDLAIEATGATEVPNIGLRSLKPRGTLVLFSLVWQPEVLDLRLLNMKELNVLGACRSLDCFAGCVEMMATGRINIKSLIDIETPLEEINKAVMELNQNRKNVFKAVLHPKQ
jgi:threonine dehydrogenase-like Zn-dependent dehydrogenase